MRQVLVVVLAVLLGGSVYGQNLTEILSNKGAPSGRIVNGVSVSIQNYSFIVALRVYGNFICGGSIISNKHVVTAAHCLASGVPPSAVTLRAGSSKQDSGGVIFGVSSYVTHPNYNSNTNDNDAAIVTISGSFAGVQNMAVIPLQETEITISSRNPPKCYALGWGYTNGQTRTLPDNLQYVDLQLVTQNTCAQTWGTSALTQQMICARYNNVDMCNGDSGGPLVCRGRLVGITSWGAQYCPGLYPTIFGKVASSSILSFIKKNTVVQ